MKHLKSGVFKKKIIISESCQNIFAAGKVKIADF